MELPFGNILDKNLYAYQRTPSKGFPDPASECDTSIGRRVTMMFAGMRIRFISGALAISPERRQKALQSGWKMPDGTALAVNEVYRRSR